MDDPDVIVIGAGPGGGSAALGLVRAGARVLLLDAGPAYDFTQDYRLDRPDWERAMFPDKGPPDDGYVMAPLQALDPADDDLATWSRVRGRRVTDGRRADWGYAHVQGIGGSTLHFSGEAHRMRPASMRLRSDWGVGADWPISYDELEPWYAEAERVVGVAGPPGDWGPPRSAPYPLPPHALSHAGQRVAEGCARLGLTLHPGALAILSQPYDERPPCNYCANCFRGCPRGDRGSVDLTFVPRAVATGRCAVRPLTRVLRLEAGPGDRVLAAHVRGPEGEARLAARAFVVACGAVHSPRLLLASGRLGDEAGQLGRHFMETLFFRSAALHPDPLGSHRGHPSEGAVWDFDRPDAFDGIVGGAVFSFGAPQAGLSGPLGYARAVVPGWGRGFKRRMRDSFGRALAITGVGECLPNPGSYVDLDPGEPDAHGVPRARIHSHLPATEITRLRAIAGTARAILAAAGADETVEEGGAADTFLATHVFGTCRMGRDPEDAVVDPAQRVFRWRNLYVSDASVFPSTGGGVAPSLTIEALGLRAGAGMARALAAGDI